MGNLLICRLTWSDPMPRTALLKAEPGFTEGHFVYAITVGDDTDRALVRIGASADLSIRLRGYRVLDLMSRSGISWCAVPDGFVRELETVLAAYFTNAQETRPRHLVGKTLSYCIARELKSIEYKVERILLETYKKRHGCLPPGNARTGSVRSYLKEARVIEEGSVRVLDKPCARITSIPVSGDQLMKLLW